MRAVADCMTLRVTDDPEHWFDLGPASQLEFGPGMSCMMRTDPPVDANYIHDTQILGMAQRQGAMVVNDPQGLRDFNEKLAALLFPQCCPPTLVSRDLAALKAFVGEHGQAVLKPLDGMGGRSIFRAGSGEPNLNVILETLTDGGLQLAMAQRYLPEDRRWRQTHPAGRWRTDRLLPGTNPAGRRIPRQPGRRRSRRRPPAELIATAGSQPRSARK